MIRTRLQTDSLFSSRSIILFITGLALLGAGCSSDSNHKTPAAAGPRIATWAGDGIQGDNVDGLDRTNSSLNQPMEMVFGPDGRAYIVDWNNHKIRREKSDGTMETLIGTILAGDWPCQNPADPANCEVPLNGAITGTELSLNHPMDIVFKADGTAYIAAWHDHKVLRYDPATATGNVTILAGQQKPGFVGDNGPASASLLNFDDSLVMDEDENLFVTDERNNRIRRISAADGTIMTVAGSSAPPATIGYDGDGGAATLAKLAFTAPNEAGGSDNPPPGGTLAMDADGNLYISDTFNHCIRKIVPGSDGVIGDGDPAEEIITTLAGQCTESGPAVDGASLTDTRFYRPHDIEFGPDGRLYVADTYNNVVRAIDLTNNTVATIAGTGEAGFSGDGGSSLSAQLHEPYGIGFDAAGNLYIVDTLNNRIRVVLTKGSSLTVAPVVSLTSSGSGTVTLTATASDPDGGAITKYEWDFDGDGTFEDDTGTTKKTTHTYSPGTYIARVRVTDNEGQSSKAAVTITVGAASGAGNAVIVLGTSGTIATIAGTGVKATDPVDANLDGVVDGPIAADQARFDSPTDMTFNGTDHRLYLMDWNGHKVRVVGSNGSANFVDFVTGTGAEGDACETALNSDGSCPAASAEFNHMTNVVFDSAGRMVVAAWHNSKIKRLDFTAGSVIDLCGTGNRKFEGDGSLCTTTGTSFDLPSGVVFDSAGNLFISDQANQVIRRLGTDGIIKTVAGKCPGTPGFGCTAGQGYDGDNGPATLAHLRNNVAQGADPQGKISMDSAGNLYIADTGNNVIRKVVPGSDGFIGDGDPNEEIITTIAGNGVAGYSGDGGPATSAMLNAPRYVKAASDGTIYIADTTNFCVRKIDLGGVITTAAGQCGQSAGFSGDGGSATAATLNRPYGVELDADGNLYIADTLNNRIRVVYK